MQVTLLQGAQYAPLIGTWPATTGIDRQTMIVTTANNLLMCPSLKRCAGFYQYLLRGFSNFKELGNRLIYEAELAHAFRDTEKMKEAALMLANLPLKDYQAAAHYYLAWVEYKKGQPQQARLMFEQVIDNAPRRFKARALLSLGTIESINQDTTSELRYYLESLKASQDLSTRIEAYRGIAVIKAKEGYHQSSVKDFDNLLPLASKADTFTRDLYLSSFAVELGASGRLYEARNVIHHVLESPFAIAYPEWRDTEQELRPASRSFVVPKPTRIRRTKILHMPEPDASVESQVGPPAKVVSMAKWKKKMAKRKKGNGFKPAEEMDIGEMLMEIMRVYTEDTTTDEQRYRIYKEVVRVMSGPDKDDDDDDYDPAS